jgi:protein SCO1
MRPRNGIGRVALLALLTSTPTACSRSPATPQTAAATAHVAAEAVPDEGGSIYVLDLALVDQTGHALHLADLRGRAVVAAMVYTTCTSVCPRLTADLKVIERQLAPADKAGVTFALFSLDPGRDTPAALTRFAGEHGLDPARWRLLAASEDGVRELAAVFGVRYKREGSGDIAHSAMIVVIDREGVVRHRQMGLGADQAALVAAVRRARL